MSGVIAGGTHRVEDGAQAVVVEPATTTSVLRAVGKMFEAELNQETVLDLVFPDERWLQGLVMEIENHTPGDYAELTVWAPDGQGGEIQLAQFAETVYIKPSKRTSVVMQTSTKVPPGIKIRYHYFSVGTSGPKPVVYVDFITWREPG